MCMLFLSLQVSAERTSDNPVSTDHPDTSEEEIEGAVELDTMDKLLAIPEVAKKKEECLEEIKGNSNKNLEDCVWDKVKGTPLEDEIAKVIEESEKKQSKDSQMRYEARQITPLKSDREKDPAIKALESHLVEKYEKAFYGEKQKGKPKQNVAHGQFYALYKTQLGKNLIGEMSEFCLNSNFNEAGINFDKSIAPRKLIIIKKEENDRKDQRDENVKALSKNSQELFRTGGKDGSIQSRYETCVGNIQLMCDNQFIDDPDKNKTPVPAGYESCTSTTGLETKENCEYTRQQACLVVQKMQEVRQNLIATNKITKRLEDLGKSSVARSFETSVQNFESKGENSMNSLTTLTSNEAVNASGFKEASDSQYEKFKKECFATSENDKGEEVAGAEAKHCERCAKYD